MRHLQLVITLAWLAGSAALAHAQNVPADAIYLGGAIVTIDDTNPGAEAIAVKDGKIMAVGKRDEVDKCQGPGTKVIDLSGKTLLPGFIDGHSHFINSLLVSTQANCYSPPAGPANSIRGHCQGADGPQTAATYSGWGEQLHHRLRLRHRTA